MAKDTYYFSHDVNASNDPKIIVMKELCGVISYAWWWILIEQLAAQEEYKLPMDKITFTGLGIAFGMKQNEAIASSNEAIASSNEAKLSTAKQAEAFVILLINECELLETDGDFFWSPSLLRRNLLRKKKQEEISKKRSEAGRLGGLKSGKARSKTKQMLEANEANEAIGKERKGYNSYSYSYGDARENENSENVLTMFDENSNKQDPYKNVFKIYMNDVGEISSITKEKLEYLVNDFGEDEVITAISKASEAGKASIAYITAILNNKIREEAANGANKRSSETRKAKTKAVDTEIDWSKETADWL